MSEKNIQLLAEILAELREIKHVIRSESQRLAEALEWIEGKLEGKPETPSN